MSAHPSTDTTQLITANAAYDFGGWDSHDPARLAVQQAVIADLAALGLEQPAADAQAEGDYEDYWENAIRASSYVRASQEAGLDAVYRKPHGSKLNQAPRFTPEELARRLGPVTHVEQGGWSTRDSLLHHELVLAQGGRELVMAGVDFERGPDQTPESAMDGPEMHEVLLEMHQAGHTQAVIKLAGNKAGVYKVSLQRPADGPLTKAILWDRLSELGEDSFGWTLVRLDGQPRSMQISTWIPMTYEYRLFVVDGRVISAAANIEEFTPIDHLAHPEYQDSPFDPRMRRHRGNNIASAAGTDSVPEVRYDLLQHYLDFAQEHITQKRVGTVVVDLAINAATDEVIVVELNDLPNSGLFASDPYAVSRALITAADRGYRLPNFSAVTPEWAPMV